MEPEPVQAIFAEVVYKGITFTTNTDKDEHKWN